MLAFAPLIDGWHPVLRALVLTLLVVPAAVYLVVPRLFAAYGVLIRRRRSRH
jgi:antibiotic biosynthesis monooxygenase (ABM) superfamily enzyme